MSSRYNVLYHGEPGEAAEELIDREASAEELRAGLINALRRINHLERKVLELSNQVRERAPTGEDRHGPSDQP